MAITLITDTITAKTTKHGAEILDLTAGKHIEIKTKTPTVELLDAEVPAGKKWRATISVYIEETAA